MHFAKAPHQRHAAIPEFTKKSMGFSRQNSMGAIEQSIVHLAYMESSPVNGCTFCIDMHLTQATRPQSPLANPYCTADGRWLMLVVQPKDFAAFARAIGRPCLSDDPRSADATGRMGNSAALVAELDAVFATQSIAHWKQVLEGGRVIFSVV